MFKQLIKVLGGDPHKRLLKSYQPIVEQVNALEPKIQALSDDELQAKTKEFQTLIKERLAAVKLEKLIKDDVPKMPGQIRTTHDAVLKDVLEEILPEAFAVCREAGKRVLNMRHFDVQLIGGIQIHRGGIAEMQTGEGKTLVCTLPAYLNGLTGRGVHVITVNDYLARRDSEWMGKLYGFLGLSTGLVVHGKNTKERQEAYACDITYGTNNEFGFDYLRDNMETSIEDCVQRAYYMSIVDEVDSILIDEARTPLIISGLPDKGRREVYAAMAKVVLQLSRGADEKDQKGHYYVDEKARNVILTDEGIKKAEQVLKVKDLWDPETNLAHYLINALKAKEVFIKDTDYIVKSNESNKRKEVIIVDEFTGRLMEGRRWGDGLHQAVEAKEGVYIQEETLTMASITFQNLFRLYPKLSGMTGTALTEAEEFEKIYNLGALQIPTNKPNIRKDLNDIVYKTEFAKFFAVAEDIVREYKKGRPVLVGTTSIEKSEFLGQILSKPQLATQVLQQRIARFIKYAKKHKAEDAEFLKLLDRPGNLTLEKAKPFLDKISTNDDDFKFAVDSLSSVLEVLDAIRAGINANVLNAKHHEKEAHIVRQAGRPGAVTIATNMAGRGTDIVLGGYKSNDPDEVDYDVIDLDAQQKVKELGGLYVLATERHESRRIDNQLRGRCARQGDPGASRFYLSLEDNLMRIFGGDKITMIMNMLNADDDLPIEANMVSGAIGNAQKKVEAHNFDIRKHVLQYDDVINTQREVIYRERRQILEGEDIHENIVEMIESRIDEIIYSHLEANVPTDVWYDDSRGHSPITVVYDTIKIDFGEAVYDKLPDIDSFKQLGLDPLVHQLKEVIMGAYSQKEANIGSEIIRKAERQIMLHVIDSKWIEHIHAMDSLREGIHLKGYGQKDPLIEYKKEAFDMFDELLERIQQDTVTLLYHAQIVAKQNSSEKAAA